MTIALNQQFGKLTVVRRTSHVRKHGYRTINETRWICQCTCGDYTEVPTHSLLSGQTRSCGGKGCCAHLEARYTKPEYSVWSTMRNRCSNPNNKDFSYYGGRGVTVCPRWTDFDNFFEDMGERPTSHHTLDRIDNAGNYEPTNCKWSTRQAQANNRGGW